VARAPGVRRILAKNKGHLELFILGRFIMAEGRNFDVITTAETVNNFFKIRENLKKTSQAYFWAEAIDKLIQEREPNLSAFSLLVESFTWLEKTRKMDFDLANLYFMIKLIKYLGFEPELSRCVHCSKKLEEKHNYFTYKFGGIICSSCYQFDPGAVHISSRQIKLLRLLERCKIDIIEKIKIESKEKKILTKIIQRNLETLSERKFNSADFIKKISNEGQRPRTRINSMRGSKKR
jgi:DNA repair protein RecO (recombination protein O)